MNLAMGSSAGTEEVDAGGNAAGNAAGATEEAHVQRGLDLHYCTRQR